MISSEPVGRARYETEEDDATYEFDGDGLRVEQVGPFGMVSDPRGVAPARQHRTSNPLYRCAAMRYSAVV